MEKNLNKVQSEKLKYEALTIAKFLLSLDPDREYFSSKKAKNKFTLATIIKGKFLLNQMLYLLQISYYINDNRLLFKDALYAWDSGVIVYSVYTRFWELYLQKDNQDLSTIKEEDKTLIAKRFNYLKVIPDKVIQEFACNDYAWSSTWGVSPHPDIKVTDKKNQEIYQRFFSHWLQEARS